MIIKNYEITKINFERNKLFLLYGDNEGFKNEIIENITKHKKLNKYIYYESEIFKNKENFFNSLSSKSFFENEKCIIIKKVSEKIKDIIDEIILKKYDDFILVLEAELLEKKSKLRNLFEKNKELICIAFYPDTFQNLNSIALNFFKKRNIRISNQSINLIIERANNKRQNLNNELEKINNYLNGKKEINFEDVLKLTNLSGEYDISILIDSCLAKNENQLIKIINENNFSNDDSVMILRYLLNKSKRLLKIKDHIEQNNDNVEVGIASFKPPIFWKEKDTIKKQIKNWTKQGIVELIDEVNRTELIVKKNFSFSINILLDFIFNKTRQTSS